MLYEFVSHLICHAAGEGGLVGSSGDVLTASLVERDEGSRAVSSHSTAAAGSDGAPANTTTTLLESNFDHPAFPDSFTFHVTVSSSRYFLLINHRLQVSQLCALFKIYFYVYCSLYLQSLISVISVVTHIILDLFLFIVSC